MPKHKDDVIQAFEMSIRSALCKHSLQLWEFRNDESHKDENISVTKYKKDALDDKIQDA
jgi:hypothetical protein